MERRRSIEIHCRGFWRKARLNLTAAKIPLFLIAFSNLAIPVGIEHIPPESCLPGKTLTFSFSAAAPEQIASGELNLREKGQLSFRTIRMVREGNLFAAKVIPSGSDGLEYFLLITTRDGTLIVLPPGRSRDNPQEVLPVEETATGELVTGELVTVTDIEEMGTGTEIEVLSPDPGSRLKEKRIEVLFGFTPSLGESLFVMAALDGKDVSSECDIEKDFLLFAPAYELSGGRHIFTVQVDSPRGTVRTQAVEFFYGEGNPFSIQGNASLSYQKAVVDEGDASSYYLSLPPGGFILCDLSLSGQRSEESYFLWLDRNPFYTPSYQTGFQFSKNNFQVEAGNLFPFVSEITLYGVSPKGISGEYRSLDNSFSVLALKTGGADNLTGIYDQYLGSVRIERAVGGRISLGGLVSYSTDKSSSLTVPLFPALRNALISGNLSIVPWKGGRVGGELAYSAFDTIGVSTDWTRGTAYEAKIEEELGARKVILTFRRVPDEYLSLGAPYLEKGRESLVLEHQGKLFKSNYTLRGSRITSLSIGQGTFGTDGWEFVGRFDVPFRNKGNLYTGFEYRNRPYDFYEFETKTASLGLTLSILGGKIGCSSTLSRVTYSSADTSAAGSKNVTDSFSFSLSYERSFLKERLKTKVFYSGFSGKDSGGLYSQTRKNPLLSADFALAKGYSLELRFQTVDRTDRIDPLTSYRESVYAAVLKKSISTTL
ncbi:MAG: hypothetical protein QME66_12545 [Candidatus Eisenbacteria bacterium]|nr:hypothetical protein [Candidatus Eisenbacteria bacterium]